MKPRKRIIKTLKGENVDRAPMWLREEWNIDPPENYDNSNEDVALGDISFNKFTDEWTIKDKYYKEVKNFYRQVGGDILKEIVIPGNISDRILMIPSDRVKKKDVKVNGDTKKVTYEINTPKGNLTFINKYQKDITTTWTIKHPVETKKDIDKIISIPYKWENLDFSKYHEYNQKLGKDGIMVVNIDTPLITVSGMMDFQKFLMLCGNDKGLLRELCDIAFERIERILDACLKEGLGPVFRLMGCEQATPPMNSPRIYRDFVYKYEKELIKKIHAHDCFAAVHCHGKIKRVLPMMLEMGVDLLDPVEAPPSGDIEFSEAKELVAGEMTLAGNIQLQDLEQCSSQEIENQVKNILTRGRKDHIILNTTASPLTYMNKKLRDNYLTMIKAGLKYGKFN